MSEQKIEGVPENWRLLRIGRAMQGEWILDNLGDPELVIDDTRSSRNYCIIEKIVKYRDVTPDDIGKMVEIQFTVWNGGKLGNCWQERKLLAILPDCFPYRYIYQASSNDWGCSAKARRTED
jgi:hypothetical protein